MAQYGFSVSFSVKYVFEFKLNGTAQEALDQIREKEYFRPFQNSGKKVVAVGVEFNKTTRNLKDWMAEDYLPKLLKFEFGSSFVG